MEIVATAEIIWRRNKVYGTDQVFLHSGTLAALDTFELGGEGRQYIDQYLTQLLDNIILVNRWTIHAGLSYIRQNGTNTHPVVELHFK